MPVAPGKVIIDRNDMDAPARQRVQAGGERSHKCLSFAGRHLRYLALVQREASHDLDVKMAHAYRPFAGLPHARKHLRQDLLKRLFSCLTIILLYLFDLKRDILFLFGKRRLSALRFQLEQSFFEAAYSFSDPLFERIRFGAQLAIGQLANLLLKAIHGFCYGRKLPQLPLILRSYYFA